MLKKSLMTLAAAVVLFTASAVTNPVDYVNALMGTQSKFSLSNGNTTPTVCALGYERMDSANRQKRRRVVVYLRRRQDSRIQANPSSKPVD